MYDKKYVCNIQWLLLNTLNIFFQVQATHPYANEDEDELTFEAGEIIYVVPFDNPDEQARLLLIQVLIS